MESEFSADIRGLGRLGCLVSREQNRLYNIFVVFFTVLSLKSV